MKLKPLTLGERMVMIARIAAAEHIRQAAAEAGVDLVRIQTLLREAHMPPGPFNSNPPIKPDPQEAA